LLEGWYIRILRRAFGSRGREHVHLSRTCQLAEVGDPKDGRCYFAGVQGLQSWRGTLVRYVREFDASRFAKQQTKKMRQPPRSRRGEVAVFTTGLGDRHILGQALGWHSRSRPKGKLESCPLSHRHVVLERIIAKLVIGMRENDHLA